ncbi:MAG TPA: hypothetical protein VHV83_07205 [Armatimonadota bacterium]|nr:hypothetical protein [Armatimonadota bacterium]
MGLRRLCVMIFLLSLSLMTLAASTPAQVDTTLTPALLNQLNLTPQQQKQAERIMRGMNQALLVPVYREYSFDRYASPIVPNRELPYGGLTPPPEFIPIDQAIALYATQLTAELMRQHPNPIAVQGYTRQIITLRQTRQLILTEEYKLLSAILTPEQRQLLPTAESMRQTPQQIIPMQ